MVSVRSSLVGFLLSAFYKYFLPNMISITASWEKMSYVNEVRNSREISKDTFDFIIVGGGSAGSVLTNRLSEHFSVLLLERGGEPNPFSEIPLLSVMMHGHPDVDYAFKSVPQSGACLGCHNKACSLNRGKGLGGSSNLNWQIYLRGHPLDYNTWANITGDERWSYKKVLPFFLKSEQYCVSCEKYQDDPTFNPLFHNTNGLLSIEKSTSQPLGEEFLQALEWDGIMRTDLNAPYTEGCSPILYTQRRGRRCSTKIAFIDPIRTRPNLTIRKYARAYKLLFRTGSNEVFGVQYEHLGVHKIAYATKEIIISTGAIETPKLLMLSGIGPKEHLKSLKIPVRLNLPVGQNFQDHLASLVGPFLLKNASSLMFDRDFKMSSILEFFTQGTGTLTQTGGSTAALFVSNVAKENGESLWPDMQYMFSGLGIAELYKALPKAVNIREDLTNPSIDPFIGRDGFMVLVLHQRPKSRGEITLASNQYQDDPLIDPKYLSDEQQTDIKTIVEAVKRVVHLSENAPSLKQLNSQFSSVPYSPCANLTFRSDEYWNCCVRYFSLSLFHYSGSASMGRVGSPDAVVDSELRVIGAKGLRVIDASIMPRVPSVNINAPTIMVAERGAQFILDTYLS